MHYKVSIIILLVSAFSLNAKVTELPITVLPTGQVLIEAELAGISQKQLFILETSGKNIIRKDMPYRLHNLGIDSTETSIKFEYLKIGDLKFTKGTTFKARKKLENRGEYAFPAPVLGTIGPAIFGNKTLQLNYETGVLKIADSAEELNIPEGTPKISFTQSFLNSTPVFEVECIEFGLHQISLAVSIPIGINLAWNEVSSGTQNRYGATLETYKTSIDGINFITLSTMEVPELYINHELTLDTPTLTFTNNITPCMGNLFLKNYLLTIDFKDGKIYFDAINEFGKNLIRGEKEKKKRKKNKK